MICYVLAMGKQHLGPHVVVGYGIKIAWPVLFITSPDHLEIIRYIIWKNIKFCPGLTSSLLQLNCHTVLFLMCYPYQTPHMKPEELSQEDNLQQNDSTGDRSYCLAVL